ASSVASDRSIGEHGKIHSAAVGQLTLSVAQGNAKTRLEVEAGRRQRIRARIFARCSASDEFDRVVPARIDAAGVFERQFESWSVDDQLSAERRKYSCEKVVVVGSLNGLTERCEDPDLRAAEQTAASDISARALCAARRVLQVSRRSGRIIDGHDSG